MGMGLQMQGKPLVIIADDSNVEREIIARWLAKWEYQAIHCHTGQEAVEQVKKNPIVVLMDVVMPEMDGYEACRQIKAAYPSLPVIMMTAYDNVSALEKAFSAGADDYLPKPLYWPLLKMRLHRLVERRSLQEALLRREAHLQCMLQAGADACWYGTGEDDKSKIDMQLMRPLFPVPGAATPLETLIANLHPDDREKTVAQTRAFLAGTQGDVLEQIYRLRVADGEWRWFFSRGRILSRDAATGRPIQVGGVISDVHQQKMMEQQLAEAQLLGRTGSWSLEAGSEEITVSMGFCRLLDIPEDTRHFDIARILEKVHPHDREALAVTYNQLWKQRNLVRFEFRTADDNDAASILQGEARVIFDSEDRPRRLVGTLIDITERRRLESLMRDSLRRMNLFVEAVSDVSFILDETGQYVQIFGQKPELLIAPPSELIGRNMKDVLPHGVADSLMKAMKKALETGKQQAIEYELLVGNDYRRFGGKMVPMQYSQEGRQSVALFLVDITSKHRTEEALRLSYERRRRNDYYNDLIAGKRQPPNGAELIHGESFDESKFYSFSLLLIESWRGERLENWLQHKRMQLQYVIDELIDRLSKTPGQMAWDAGEGRIGLIVLREDENYLSDKGFCAWLKGTEARFTGIKLLAGIASYGNTSPLAQRYQEALQAIDVGTRIWPGRNCYSFTELGVFQILVPMSRTDVTERFVQQTLGALLEYDQQKGADLVVTLDAILTYPNLREAADKLFIHYKTLLFRRKRIEELLKMSLDDADNRVSLSVALRMWRLSH